MPKKRNSALVEPTSYLISIDPQLEYNMVEGYRWKMPEQSMKLCMNMPNNIDPAFNNKISRRIGNNHYHNSNVNNNDKSMNGQYIPTKEEQRFFGLTTDKMNMVARTEPLQDATMGEILNPELRSLYGLTEDDLLKPRSKLEIKEMFEAMGLRYKLAKLEGAWLRAVSFEGEGNMQVSLNSVLQAFREMHYVN